MQDTDATERPSPALRRRWRRQARATGVVVVVGFAAYFVVKNWTEIVAALRGINPWLTAAALISALVGLSAAALSWRAVLTGLGSKLPVRAGARIYFVGQLGKYIPGSVWPVLAQAELSKEYDVRRTRAAFASAAQVLVGLAAGVAIAALALAAASRETLTAYWWLLPVAAVVLGALVPPVFNRLMAFAMRLARRPSGETLQGRALAAAAAWSALMWIAFGAHTWLLALALGYKLSLLLATGAYAVAWSVGFVIVFLPAGAGAREAALVLALSPAMPREAALALALVSRVLMLLGDFGCALVAALAERRRVAPGVGAQP